jgi:VanZ family protein
VTAVLFLGVLVASVVPLPSTGGAGRGLAGLPLDKVGHALEYGLLAASVAWAVHREAPDLDRHRWLVALGIVVGVTLLGAVLELVQGPLPWRHASVADALANAIGATLGVAVAMALLRE